MRILRTSCADCDYSQVERIPRSFWMRWLPSLRHYYCRQCDSALLAPKVQVESRQWMMTTFKDIPVGPPMHAADNVVALRPSARVQDQMGRA